MFPFDYFEDPRFRQHRILQVTLCSLGLFLLVAVSLLLLWQQRKVSTPAPQATTQSVPAVQPAPTARRAELVQEAPTPTPVPETPEKRIAEAQRAYAAGEREKARAILAHIDLDAAASSQAWELSGLLQVEAGNKLAAEELYSRGILRAPSSGLYYHRALLNRDRGNLEDALQDIDQAAALSPIDFVVSNERYLLLLQMGKKEQVRDEITALLSSGVKTDKKAWILGLCGLALENGQISEAAKLLAATQTIMDPASFHQLLNNPVLTRYQNRPEIFPFYMVSAKPSSVR